ncbi:MAG: hypothetical protein R3272_03555 [Candidatus Promineifilaceae bacterium]|nr:hypothetical protein [Candidatus Promineifilaceae bacterium]
MAENIDIDNLTPEEEITNDDKLWALLSYIFTPLVPVIALLLEDKKARPFIRYNAWVSLILGILFVITSYFCVGIIFWIYAVYLGIKAYNGEWVEVPVVSDFVRNQGWA